MLMRSHAPTQSSRTLTWGLYAIVAVLIVIAAFATGLWELVFRWHRQEEYSHGFLVPAVTMWMLWARRDAIRASIGRPSWIGLLLVLVAVALLIFGELSAIFMPSQIGFVVALMGLTLAVGGYSLLRVTFIPIVFLLFAIPLPYFVDSMLSFRLQLISSELGVFFIDLFRIPVYLQGNIIDLGYYKLQVVEACSGLRYLYPLLCLSFLAAYMFHAPIWQRTIVFLSSIPITIIMNGFRIGMVGVSVDRFGTEAADEVLHAFEGWIIFIACSILLAGEIFIFARLSGRRFFDVFYLPKGEAVVPREPKARAARYVPVLACLAVICVAGVACQLVSRRPELIPERTAFVAFPSRIDQWQGHVSSLEPQIEYGLGLDDYILTDYAKPDRKAVNLYVAYYASQRKGVSPHSPAVCIPGGGWQITNLERTVYRDSNTEFPINRVVIEQGSDKQIVYYWFDERGKKIANEWWSKWQLLVDALVLNRTDGALVRLVTPVYPGELEPDADVRLRSFMKELVPTLTGYLPAGPSSPVRPVVARPSKTNES